MQGIIIVDKPQGFTSFDVVAKLRGICATRKIGHGGTLDPMATGVLPVFLGRATKAIALQPCTDKCYEAVMRLGLRTDTGDITGKVLEKAEVPSMIDEEAVRAVLPRFLGASMQMPPMYSAVKVNGRPLYKAARAGIEIERSARPIDIYALQLLQRQNEVEYSLRLHCGKGTYVRVLIEDIGRALGVPAVMSALRRTKALGYSLAQAYTLEQIEQAKRESRLGNLVLGAETAFAKMKQIQISAAQKMFLLNGAVTDCRNVDDGEYCLFCKQEFVGIGIVGGGVLRQKKLFCERK